MSVNLQIAALTPGLLEPSIALAASRAGELGILDFEYVPDSVLIIRTIRRFNASVAIPFGVKLDGDVPELIERVAADLPDGLRTVIVTSARPQDLQPQVRLLQEKKVATLLEATSLDVAQIGEGIRVDGLVAKGHEAGGRIGEETTFILLQRFLAEVHLPVWAHGGIGLHTAAACGAAGAAGLILDVQLALTRESPLPEAIRVRIANMDGSETISVGNHLGQRYRVYFRPRTPVLTELQDIELRLANEERPPQDVQEEWRQAVADRVGWDSEQKALLIGQDAAFAAPLAERYRTTGGVLQAIRDTIRTHCQTAVRLRPLAEGSPLARSNRTRYPILQGPMTRVSDVPEFAARVAEGGALPFLALAVMRGEEIKVLLEESQRRLGTMPWGVGILGFVPPELREEQINAISNYAPPYALIAGGRPDQARALEQKGIITYLHVPSPGLLRMFAQQGARRFVFEGRECGGHVGPRTSFVLWNQMVDVLLDTPELAANPQEFHVVFAAGIHDALSAAMVSVIGAPLAERGVRIGVLLGTAYLFTQEAVACGAIQEAFQQQAQQCRSTVLLETGPGHSTRCVDTPYAAAFANEKRRLVASGHSAEQVRVALEELNLGRLRIASKGVTRHPRFGQDPAAPKLVAIGKDEQVAEGMYMIGQVAALRQTICTVQDLHHDVSVAGSNRLETFAGRSQAAAAHPKESPSDVAIIGMACLLPKASGLRAYWENIFHKVDAIGEIPKDRWDWELYFDSDPKAKDKIYSRWGGFLDEIPFDPVQYGMPPASLPSIEPSQLLTLEVVRAALSDAGYLARPFARERTSVILGAGGGAADLGLSYSARSFLPVLEELPEFRGRSQEIVSRLDGRLPEWTEDSFAGILTNVSAGRVANRFDLGGSNYTVDAACASSLAAVSVALKELEARTSDMVIVGGVDTMQNPFTYLCFSKTHALSPRGRCRAFDESADGIVISEGIGIMVFKRLAEAERDGDRIYAVIKAAGSSSDGKDRGLTAPRPQGQSLALRRAYAKAGISPATVELIEAHGTGTVAGDQAEVQALTEVFTEAGAPRQGCAVGSVKSMIGHTKCTAGAAGLIKAALALHHKVLPPTLGVETPNPRAHFGETPFFINTAPRPWLNGSGSHPRRAGVSAFGFGGTNFHVVLEEYAGAPSASLPAPSREWSDELFLWQGKSGEDVLGALEVWEQALAGDAAPELRDLAYTAWKQADERSGEARLAIIARSTEDLKQKLRWARQRLAEPPTTNIYDPRGIYFCQQPIGVAAKLAFLFPGQGSQYPRMLEDLLLYFPEMRHVFEQAAHVVAGKLGKPLAAYVFPPAPFSREEEQAQQQALTQTNVAQPALGAVSLAMFGLLQQFGLQPDMVAGHSYGEYVALAAAGALDPETLIALSEARGRFIVEGAGPEAGIMAAIEADAETVLPVVAMHEGVCLANANAPRQSVISGLPEPVERVVQHFAARGTSARMIPVACAFHSPLVEPAQLRLAQFLSTLPVAEPRITVYSNTTAAPYPNKPEAVKAQLAEHLVRPVEFVREIQSMYEAGARVFVEVGPRGVLTSLVDEILGDRPKLAVASNQSGRPGLTQLLHMLGLLSVHGYGLKLERLFRDRSDRRLNLRALEQECMEKPVSPSVWMVNGARARQLKTNGTERKQATPGTAAPARNRPAEAATPPGALAAAEGTPSLPSSSAATPVIPALPELWPAANMPLPSLDSPAASVDGAAQVMAQFQQMMARFLETQKTVMLAYLGAGSAGSAMAPSVTQVASMAAAAPAQVQSPIPATTVEARSVPPRAPEESQLAASPDVPAQEPTSLPSRLNRDDLKAQLLSIVSERTGYPLEMLDLSLDLEADLGIDSIKRVEILGTLQQSLAASGITKDESLMEKLSGVRTLAAIIERLSEEVIARSAQSVADAAGAGHKRSHEPHSQGAARPSKEELTKRLIAIVSERTGYPPEMLNLNLDLEADLGIDSIKRVEILGTFQQAFAAGIGGEDLMEKLSGVRTLQGIIDRVFEQLEFTLQFPHSVNGLESSAAKPADPIPDTVSPAKASSESKAEEGKLIHRFTLRTVETSLPAGQNGLAKDRTIMVIGSGQSVGRELAGELRRSGYQVAVVSDGPDVQQLESGSYAANLDSSKSVTELIELVGRKQAPLGAVVHLLCLQPPIADVTAHEEASWGEQVRLGVKTLFHIAKAAGKHLREAGKARGASLIAATGMGGSFGISLPEGAAAKFPGHGAVVGLMKTLALEWPEVRVKSVDFNIGGNSQVLARHLLDELHAEDGLVEVGYDGSRRVSVALTHAPLDLESAKVPVLDQSSVVLITGGARGITARAAKRLAELYRPTLVIAGRSPLPPPSEAADTAGITRAKDLKAALMEQRRASGAIVTPAIIERAYARLQAEREVRSNLAALQDRGAAVHYFPVDVRDEKSFGAFIDTIYELFGRLDAVVHGAGVIEDRLLEDKTAESFDRVFETKVNSAFVLCRKLRPDSLRWLLFFSSVSARFGNRGQADYAAANEVLNKLAVYLDRRWPGRIVAMNWGPWDTEGMVSAEVRKQFAERGVELIPSAVGLKRLEEEIHHGSKGDPEVVIGGAEGLASRPAEARQNRWPLLGRAVLSSTQRGLELVRELDPRHDLYLKDHCLDDLPVLPLAIATELMAESVAQAWPEMQVSEIRNLRLLHGIVLEGGKKTVRVVLTPQSGAQSNPSRVAVEVIGNGHPRRIHYRATAELASRLLDAPMPNLPPLANGHPFSRELVDVYREWLFHGPLFHGIRRIDHLDMSGVKAVLATSSPVDWVAGATSGSWLIDPLMFDCALQLVLVWAREHWDMTALPSGFQKFRRYAAPSATHVRCELRIRPNTGGQTIHSDFFFFDAATGQLLSMIEDMEGACSKTLNRLARPKVMVAGENQT